MATTVQSKLKNLSVARQTKVKRRAAELIAEEVTLAELRKALELTQVDLSKKLHVNQESISRLEKRTDLLLSTLVNYIKAMGGELTLTAKFPNRPPVSLTGLYELGHHK
jgi:DNA-binding XRE family transcriptional regulator